MQRRRNPRALPPAPVFRAVVHYSGGSEFQLIEASRMVCMAQDAVANGEMAGPPPVDPYEAATRLHEAGLIGLWRGQLPDYLSSVVVDVFEDEEIPDPEDMERAFTRWLEDLEELVQREFKMPFGSYTLAGQLVVPYAEKAFETNMTPQQFIDIYLSRMMERTGEQEELFWQEIRQDFG